MRERSRRRGGSEEAAKGRIECAGGIFPFTAQPRGEPVVACKARTYSSLPPEKLRPPYMRIARIVSRLSLLVCFSLTLRAADPLPPYRLVTNPTLDQLAADFAKPPAVYSSIHWAIWGGPQNEQRIISDIDKIHASGGGVYMINNSRGVKPAYLSPEYMDLVKTAVSEAKKVGMKVWIEGDCGYPDGFAGGADYRALPAHGDAGDRERRALHRPRRADSRYTAACGYARHPCQPAWRWGARGGRGGVGLRGGICATTRPHPGRRATRCRCRPTAPLSIWSRAEAAVRSRCSSPMPPCNTR